MILDFQIFLAKRNRSILSIKQLDIYLAKYWDAVCLSMKYIAYLSYFSFFLLKHQKKINRTDSILPNHLFFYAEVNRYHVFLIAKLLYNYLFPSVCMCVCLYVRQVQGETRFSQSLIKIYVQFFFWQISLTYEHLFCKYFFLSVCRLGYKRQKCKNLFWHF